MKLLSIVVCFFYTSLEAINLTFKLIISTAAFLQNKLICRHGQ